MGPIFVKILPFLLIVGLIASNVVDGRRPMHMKNKNSKESKCFLLKTAGMFKPSFALQSLIETDLYSLNSLEHILEINSFSSC